jgi:multiple sugar transport system permease protein
VTSDSGARTGRSRKVSSEARAAFWFLAPALGLIGVFFVIPILASSALSLTDFDIYGIGDLGTVRFVGLGNYRRLLGDAVFWKALGNTAYFAVAAGVLSVGAGLGAALAVSSRLARFKGLYRTVFFAPYVTTLVAVAVVWRYLYQPRQGLFGRVLEAVGLPAIDWLGDPLWAMPAIILLAVWKNFGYNTILFAAGLAAIPASLYEAAELDGASAWQRFRHVTLPMLAPTFFFVALITTIGNLQVFAEPYVMTRGGNPLNATLTVVMLMFKEGFRWWSIGYASSIALVLCVVVLAATGLQAWFWRGRRA